MGTATALHGCAAASLRRQKSSRQTGKRRRTATLVSVLGTLPFSTARGRWDRRGHDGAAAGRAVDGQRAVERRNPVTQPDQATAFGPRSALAVVAHLDAQRAVVHAARDGRVL